MMEAVAPERLVDGSRLNAQLEMMRKECALHDKERCVFFIEDSGHIAALWVLLCMFGDPYSQGIHQSIHLHFEACSLPIETAHQTLNANHQTHSTAKNCTVSC
jgi:hypothetical protein